MSVCAKKARSCGDCKLWHTMGDQHAEKIGNNDSASNNPGQDGEAPGPSNPPSQDEEIIDGEAQARFMERALAESARLRREADRL